MFGGNSVYPSGSLESISHPDNSLPGNTSEFIQLGTNMLAGLKALGTTLKITQITPAQFQTDLTAFVNQDNSFNAARSAKQAASDGVLGTVAEIGEWLGGGGARGVDGALWLSLEYDVGAGGLYES